MASSKLPVIILIFLLIVALTTAGLGFLALEKEKRNSETLSQEVMRLSKEKEAVEVKLEGLNKNLSEIKKNLQASTDRITQLNAELETEKKSKLESLDELTKLKANLEIAVGMKTDLENKLKKSEDAFTNVQKELASLKLAKDSLEEKLSELESKGSSVQLDKIVVSNTQKQEEPKTQNKDQETPKKTEPAPALTTALEGKILVVNKEYDFVVINLGRKDNINVGDAFDVLRKNKKLGQIKVEEVRDTMSVAVPVSKALMKQVKEEDKVVVSK